MASNALDRWLIAVAVAHVVAGLVLPALLLRTDWLDAVFRLAAEDARLYAALFGPTVASWGVLMFYLVQHGLRRGQAWAADALIVGVLVWAPLDVALSAVYELRFALLLDALVIPAILVPALIRRVQLRAG